MEHDPERDPNPAPGRPLEEPIQVDLERPAPNGEAERLAGEPVEHPANQRHRQYPANRKPQLDALERPPLLHQWNESSSDLLGRLEVNRPQHLAKHQASQSKGDPQARMQGANCSLELGQAFPAGETHEQPDRTEREERFPEVHDVRVEAEHRRTQSGRQLLRRHAIEVIEVERVVERVSLPPNAAVLDDAGVRVDRHRLEDHEESGPGWDPAEDRLESLGVFIARCHAGAVARAAAFAESTLSAELPTAQPVVDAVRVPALREAQVEEEGPIDVLGPLPKDVVALDRAVEQEPCDPLGVAGLEAEDQAQNRDLKGAPVDPPGPG